MTALTEAQAVTVAQAVASDNGLTLDADALAAVVARLTTDLGLDESRAIIFDIAAPFRIEGGKVVDTLPLAHAVSVVREHGKPVAKPATVQDAPTLATVPKPNTPVAEFGRALDAAHAAAMAHEAESWPNPFLAGPNFNRTRQAIIRNHNPALAARHQAQAGA